MDRNLIAVVAFLTLGALFTSVEMIAPARAIKFRRVLPYDIGALFLYVIFFELAVRITDQIPAPRYVPAGILDLPMPLKVLLFYLVEDFGLYWVHRFMHTKHVWRVHKWHHSPRYIYWLAGVRATVPHILLFNLTFVLALPILHSAPSWLFPLIMMEHMLRNDWMHMNVSWRSQWLEWIVVTPRYHHIHHSDDPRYYKANLGSLFTFWDRIFGTYVNPGDVKQELSFGTGDPDHLFRLVVGV